MDGVTFLKERNRMCKTNVSCYGCPAHDIGSSNSCKLAMENWASPEQQIRIVEEWSAAHPRKTRQSVFLEQYPNAKVVGDTDIPWVYPCQIDHSMENVTRCNSLSCSDCRREFWAQEVE